VTVPTVSEHADASPYALKLGRGCGIFRDGVRAAAVTGAPRSSSTTCSQQPGAVLPIGVIHLDSSATTRAVDFRSLRLGVSALSVDAAWSHCQNWRSETSGRCLVARSAIMTRSVATLKIRSTRSGSDQRWFSTKAIH
jgi:hypothetical protein